MDVLVGSALVKRRLRCLRADGIEGGDDPRALVGGEDADPLQRPREGLRAANIGIDQPPVEIERTGKTLEDFRRPGLKPPAPELHAHFAFLASARTFIGRPVRLMKPSASFWS